MCDDNSRGLESPDTTDASNGSNQRLVADGGTTWGDLSGFQRDTLEAIACLERDGETCYGLAIKHRLEPHHGEVNHGRLYSNLDSLDERGLVEKSALDKRTNEYLLTDDGRGLLHQRIERLADACEIEVAVTGSSRDGDHDGE